MATLKSYTVKGRVIGLGKTLPRGSDEHITIDVEAENKTKAKQIVAEKYNFRTYDLRVTGPY